MSTSQCADDLQLEPLDALRIVAYFDSLLARGVSVVELLRGAVSLSRATVGAVVGGKTVRCNAQGVITTDESQGEHRGAVSHEIKTSHAHVWIERSESARDFDKVICQRLAIALELTEARRERGGALEVILDAERTLGQREAAITRLRLRPSTRVRIIATNAPVVLPNLHSVVVPTRYGLLRASLDLQGVQPEGPAGLGTWVAAHQAPQSWAEAIITHRLSMDENTPIDASDLGALVQLAQAYEPTSVHEDVRRLAALDQRSAQILRALLDHDSIRGAATHLNLHHSTVQARHERLTREIGFDPRTNLGRLRYTAAELLRRLGHEDT